MIPKFKDHLGVKISPPDLLFFLDENGYRFVRGKLLAGICSFIDGVRNDKQIAKKAKVPLVDVQFGLMILEAEGFTEEVRKANAQTPKQNQILPIFDEIKADFVVFVNDYLQPGLSEFNRNAIQQEYSWLIAKNVGRVLWLGPVFSHRGACWNCLALRLREKRRVEAYLKANPHLHIKDPVLSPIDSSEFEPAIRLLKKDPEMLVTLDIESKRLERHAVIQMEHCPDCAKKRRSGRKYSHHISFRTGIVDQLQTIESNRVVHSVVADHIFVPTVTRKSFLRKGLTQKSWGKGETLREAKTGALCEALERYSGMFRGNEDRITKTFNEIHSDAIRLNDCMNFSALQYSERTQRNRLGREKEWIPMPLNEEKKIEWTRLWSCTHKKYRYLPTAYCYYGYPLPVNHKFCRADSNGNAAGSTLEEAIVNGFLEIVERDCAALWWYSRACRPALDLDNFQNPYVRKVFSYYQRIGRNLWVLDVTSDFRIPCFVAVSASQDPENPSYRIGLGCHLDPQIALIRAITEMNQFLHFANPRRRTLANDTWLKPLRGGMRSLDDFESISRDSSNNLKACLEMVRNHKMEMLFLDQTRSDVGLPVVKVIVPGMRQVWPRFAPGRLYDIPPRLGWIKARLSEKLLNQERFLI